MLDTHLPWRGKRIAVLAAGERIVGGADRFVDSLVAGLAEIGCDVETIRIPARESSFEEILCNYRAALNLNLDAFDAVISTKVPTYVVRHPRHVVYLVHTIRVFDDMFEASFPCPTRDQFRQRKEIHDLDFAGVSRARAIFCIGQEIAGRLYRKLGLRAEIIHPPLGQHLLANQGDDGSFFLPGRLHPWKRVDLAIRAVLQGAANLRLNIAGTGEAEGELKELAGGDPRIRFLGAVSDEEMVRLYGTCRGVVFVPLREDYGYITIEGFASGKPVITCHDSGEPTRIVEDGRSGLIVPSTPEAVGAAMERLSADVDLAQRLGAEGARRVADMSWKKVCNQLLAAAFEKEATAPARRTAVTVLDMQPIEPPHGGGRLRLLGLYHDLGEEIDATYVGTYDWPGESRRQLRHGDRLTEITVPLSDAHHEAVATWSALAGGKTVIDIAFSQQGHLSPDYLEQARRSIAEAEVVVFSHPWVFPLLCDRIKSGQLVVYDSHNVEVFLRRSLLDMGNDFERNLLASVASDEYQLLCRADLVLACSTEDARRFTRIYDTSAAKIRVIPNGVMTRMRRPATEAEKSEVRRALGLPERLTAIFLGSAYGPNIDAARFIAEELAPRLPDVTFVIAGGVGTVVESARANVLITKELSVADLSIWLSAADIAVNPMASGSGTNVKMFDFMAAALPVATTAVGARGIEFGSDEAFLVVEPSVEAFAKAIDRLRAPDLRASIGAQARALVDSSFAWEVISRRAGALFINWHNGGGQKRPFFSVVVPSYERHADLSRLLGRLVGQTEIDFEVIVVDQSALRFAGADTAWGFELTYIHSPVRGAIHARNLGACVAKGDIIAFIDDDCVPDPDWLLNARAYFSDPDIVGVEGRVYSDHHDDPAWRPVSNVGFEGVGFMTANLMVRQSIFQHLGGFDLGFENPHFREDTDLGWRMLELGRVPYGHDVSVFHPAQPRAIERESLAARTEFFVKDARLLRKHPERFRELFEAEGHWQKSENYLEVLAVELRRLNMVPPGWLLPYLERKAS